MARVVDLVTQEAGDDKSLIPRIPPNTAITYFDVLPEMIGYVLGNRCVVTAAMEHAIRKLCSQQQRYICVA